MMESYKFDKIKLLHNQCTFQIYVKYTTKIISITFTKMCAYVCVSLGIYW